MTIAIAIALLGNDVTLYDPAAKVLQLQSDSPRLLHPHIYEWPRLGSLNDHAGLPILTWSAGKGDAVCSALQASFASATTRLGNLRFEGAHRLTAIERVGEDWRLTLATSAAPATRTFRHVVLAMGFGDEKTCGSLTPTDYWKQSGIGTNAVEQQFGTTYLVSGNGDGGLTELLGLLVGTFEHVGFTRDFLGMFSGDDLRIVAAQIFDGAAAAADLEPALRAHLLPVLEEQGVLDRLKSRLRNDRAVFINSSGPLFEAGKASQLNQCMVFAVLEAASCANITVRQSRGHVDDLQAVEGGLRPIGIQVGGVPVDTAFKHVIPRHGPDRDTRYQPAAAHFARYRSYMNALLATRPELAEPPALDAETYDRVALRAHSKLHDTSLQPALSAQFAQEHATIVIGLDPAAHMAVEQGHHSLLDIAERCETLADPITVHLDLEPAKLACAGDLIRLANASVGRIHLKASASVHTQWTQLGGMIASAPLVPSRFAHRRLGSPDISALVDACLVRLIDTRLTNAMRTGSCPTIGTIGEELLAAIETTWATWQIELGADKVLRAHFLRLLTHVERGAAAWDGAHGCVDDLASALLMMLATHHGEPLRPGSSDRGNLLFGAEAVALGSGCRLIGQQPIAAAWTQPQHWGVEALIVSASSEISIAPVLAGTVLNGGSISKGISSARQVQPAVIQNDSFWRRMLEGSLTGWKSAVEKEFSDFRKRQNDEYDEALK
ncbi:ABC-three component system protein [Mesorhizobium sp.]|uniref:ABC-three component system protein n=1 Tax=Mesorhizobium sp. TaxID=1871066 RepID=UPI0026014836|nr:ABC-three component system protein [Mesorhizobium sp.]